MVDRPDAMTHPVPSRPPGATASAPVRPPHPLERARLRLAAQWNERPLAVVIAVAAALRLAAALLSPGFAFHDDHFEVVEVAQHWLDGARDWLGNPDSLRSLVYPGLHFALFAGLERLGVTDPQQKMLVVRLLNGAWSMLTVLYGYRIAEAVGGRDRARVAGLLVAAFWLAPFSAVRDLVEIACQPPLMIALWLLVRSPGGPGRRDALLAGLWLGVAFTIRFQILVVPGALGLVLLLQRRIAPALLLGAGTVVSAAVLQGGSDWIGYGRPFSSFLAYLAYNSDPRHVATFPTGPWHRYLGTLLGFLVPPTSLLLLAGVVGTARRLPLLFWPAFAFVAVHSIYPGKQERFLFPVLPLLLVLAAVGARDLAERFRPLAARPRLVRGLWAWFWIANAIGLAAYTTNYSKRTRVAPLSFLHARADVQAVVLETSEARAPFVPLFYLGAHTPAFHLPKTRSVEELSAELAASGARPNYVVMTGDAELDARLDRLRPLFPRLTKVASFGPGAVDWLLHRMNPRRNVNLTAHVYRVE
jgi:hypothetical protein